MNYNEKILREGLAQSAPPGTRALSVGAEKRVSMMVFSAMAHAGPSGRDEISIDEGLFPRIAAGEQEAFCALYDLTGGAVYAFSLSLLRHREDAEDAAQETFLKIRAAAHLYRPRGKPMAWIFTIARNICLMKLRQRSRFASAPVEEWRQEPDFSQIEDREDRIVLETAFRVLSEEERQIILLHAVSGLKHREVSELLRRPLSTVLSRYNRGLKKLRRALEGML